MKISINRKRIDDSGEFDFLINENEIKRILRSNIDYLATHNKNLTKTQCRKISELKAIINAIREN